MRRAACSLLVALSVLGMAGGVSWAKVYMTRQQALESVYPGADRIEKQSVFVSKEMKAGISKRARAPLGSSVFTFYVGMRDGQVLGYSLIDTHLIRTKTETVLITISPGGSVQRVDILAFFEPGDYYPSRGWMGLFTGKRLERSLRTGGDIPNMTGATLTSEAMVSSIRRALALFEAVCSAGVCKGI